MADLHRTIDRSINISRTVADLLQRRTRAANERFGDRMRKAGTALRAESTSPKTPLEFWRQWAEYNVDFAQRSVLYWDTIRRRGNQWLEHEAAGKPPVLKYKYEMVSDAREYERPANHALVRIIPPRGVVVDDTKRPFVIVDPRAGHGPGIGGFKEDSEVGVALRAGHPVYFVIFFPDRSGPAAGRRHRRRSRIHPHRRRAPPGKPETRDHRQLPGRLGGDDARRRATRHRGPDRAERRADVVLGRQRRRIADALFRRPAGRRVAVAVRGRLGRRQVRRRPPREQLRAAQSRPTRCGKSVPPLREHRRRKPERFLEFERWWGGFYPYNEEEIRWIVNNLFVGNKFSAGEARLGPGRYFDLKSIKQPIIVFASMGDNITPPQQAFNWIADVYSSSEEIKANGQTIVGLLHEDIGHLGIFVSGQVAKKEHAQIVEVLKYIQQLPPGLYGMEIEETHDKHGEVSYEVTLKERKVEDLRSLQKYDRVDEKPFEAVAALSELLERAYSLLVRPFVREMSPEWLAKLRRNMHPLRVQYWAMSDKNPFLWPLPYLADIAANNRQRRSPDNDMVKAERFLSASVNAALDQYRDLRDARSEAAFFHVYGNLLSLHMAEEREEIRRKGNSIRARFPRCAKFWTR